MHLTQLKKFKYVFVSVAAAACVSACGIDSLVPETAEVEDSVTLPEKTTTLQESDLSVSTTVDPDSNEFSENASTSVENQTDTTEPSDASETSAQTTGNESTVPTERVAFSGNYDAWINEMPTIPDDNSPRVFLKAELPEGSRPISATFTADGKTYDASIRDDGVISPNFDVTIKDKTVNAEFDVENSDGIITSFFIDNIDFQIAS